MPRDPAKHPGDDRIRIQHMLDAAADGQRMIAGRSRVDLDSDMMLRRAIVNALQDIGEAAGKVSPLARERVPSIPWDKVVRMRHRLVHGYDTLNPDTVWRVAAEELPVIVAALDAACIDWPLPPSAAD